MATSPSTGEGEDGAREEARRREHGAIAKKYKSATTEAEKRAIAEEALAAMDRNLRLIT